MTYPSRQLKCPKMRQKYISGLAISSVAVFLIIYWGARHHEEPAEIFSVKSFRHIRLTSVAAEVDKENPEAKAKRLPQAIIIGAMKCGTGPLLNMMNIHPHISVNHGEIHFFDNSKNYENGLEWYRNRMPDTSDDQVTVEKSPKYYVTPAVPERIYAMNASIKLILVVREPVTRTISEFTHLKEIKIKNNQTLPPFEQCVFISKGSIKDSYGFLRVSRYIEHLRRWIQFFPLSQILILNGDDFIKNPLPEMKKVESFFNVANYFTSWNFYFNETKGFYCFRSSGDQEECMSSEKGRTHPKVDPLLISKLRRYFAPLNECFYQLIGHSFSWPTS